MKNPLIQHEDVSDQRIRELHAANSHLLTYCDVNDTFIDYPVTYDELNGVQAIKLQIIEYFIGGTTTLRALIWRLTLADGSPPLDTIRTLLVGSTVYHLRLD